MTPLSLHTLFGWLSSGTLQTAVMVTLVAVLMTLFGRRLGARWRYALWLLVVVRLAGPVLPESRWSVFNVMNRVVDRPEVAAPLHAKLVLDAPADVDRREIHLRHETRPLVPGGAEFLIAIWLSGALLLIARLVIVSVRMRRRIRQSTETEVPLWVRELVRRSREQLHLRREVAVVITHAVRSPALHGVFRPALLLPAGVVDSFSAAELRHIVLHELWHMRRWDVLANAALSVVQALHWFNPFVWFAMARIREERELACDELALSCLEEEERFGYGRTILKLLESFRGPAQLPALVGIVNHKQQMKRRLTMIASFRNGGRSFLLFLVLAAGVGAFVLTDATAGEGHRMMVKKLDPAAHATFERLHQKMNVELTNATFTELLGAVSNATGVTITQSPEIATLPVQQSRFTLKATQVPAHLVLMESLAPLGVAPKPDANGVTIVKAEECHMMKGHGHVERAGEPGVFEKKIERRVVHGNEAGEKVHIAEIEGSGDRKKIIVIDEASGTEGDKKVFIRKMHADGSGSSCSVSADGVITRELKLKLDENGVVSEGTLNLQIRPPATK